ncbi:Vacuolar protein sorting-associated protein ist1 [Stygiomarasmius scandens]|uniref:Vacuolar protein sorting-associated protein ist1 n=1 Tax=Marasmiellus scandens TaxID=2682957 RepID=A0ABR1JVZ3_9AGAR
MPTAYNSAKTKVQLRLSVQRLRTLQQKKEAQAKASRRDIATLIERGKIETSRIKVEGLINEDIHIELLELLELYCELLLARFGVLDQNAREPDPSVAEGVCSIIFAAPRTELKELHVLRDMLMHKYGREFSAAAMENRDGCVSDRVARKIEVKTPSADLVNAYMGEIAKAYSVAWEAPQSMSKESDDNSNSGNGHGDGGVKDASPGASDSSASKSVSESKSVSPPADAEKKDVNNNNKEKESKEKSKPGSGAGIGSGGVPSPPSTKPGSGVGPEAEPEDDFDALTKRFAALKKR